MIDTESTQKNDDNLEQKHESISRRTRNQLKTEEEIKLDKRIEEITDLSSMLMGTHEELDIYDMSHGSIMGILKSEGLVPREWIPPTSVTAPSSFSSLGPTEPSQIFDQFIQQQQQPGSFNQQENSPVYAIQRVARSVFSHLLNVDHSRNRNYKTEQYDQALQGYEKATIKIYKSSAYLNIGQSVIFSLSIMVVM
ncbi:hypothetical protein H4Q26_015012 [Puccinia striiformis f. sp. tritici PST-130]|nr:hypothetical protein H4Q26_015012 [Puccinia striiformis f. sp. tritici PST-130]